MMIYQVVSVIQPVALLIWTPNQTICHCNVMFEEPVEEVTLPSMQI